MKYKLLKPFSVLSLVACVLTAAIPEPMYATEINETQIQENIDKATESEQEIPEDAIYISTEADLIAFAEDCRVNEWSIGKVVVLNNDIELTTGNFKGIPTFGGVFLGKGHTISGLHLSDDGSVVGFFRYLQKTALVLDLHIEGDVVPTGSKAVVGGFAGENAGYLVNCSFTGNVSGTEQVGGMVGNNRTSGLVHNCQVNGTVHGSHFIGGIVGENHGVVRNCENNANVNTQSVQNQLDIEDITVDSLVSTEASTTSTDIGGVAGTNSGVLRACVNKGEVGYKNMGFNIGGVAGSQKGYIVDCINYADVQGRKEVGGIVGQMEPNIVLDYDTDGLQILSSQMDSVEASMNRIEAELDDSEMDAQVDGLKGDIRNVQDALDVLYGSTETPDVENWEDWEDFEEWNDQQDQDTAARNDLSDSLDSAYSKSEVIADSAKETSKEVVSELRVVTSTLSDAADTVSNLESTTGVEIKDISASDTVEDTIGKVANCENYGTVKGDRNIGGIAGIMAKENDLDEYQDTTVVGEESLNATYEVRTVIRGCKNYGTVTINKQYAGGIVGQMDMGAIFENTNLGNIDAIHADYVGGIAGGSATLIKDCSSRAIISGDAYVGGIAGEGNEVVGCYAFSDIKAFTEKAGAVLGCANEIPDTEDAAIAENYYVLAGADIGGIDGISYVGASDKLELSDLLAKEDIPEEFRTVEVQFLIEGQNSIVITANTGDSITLDRVPVLSTEYASEYAWEVVPAVTSEVLGLDEVASVEYLSESGLANILFDQTYTAVVDAKGTVVKSAQVNEKNHPVILAGGVFARDTMVELTDMLANGTKVDGKNPIVDYKIRLSNPGVNRLHYLVPENVNPDKVKLFVKDTSDVWTEREYTVDMSYMVFDFGDEDVEFALVPDYLAIGLEIAVYAIAGAVLIGIIATLLKKRKNKK